MVCDQPSSSFMASPIALVAGSGGKPSQQEYPLRFGDRPLVEYLFCQVHVPFSSCIGFFDLSVEYFKVI